MSVETCKLFSMSSEEYKGKLRDAVQRAYRHHRRIDVAQAAGCSAQTLSNFMAGGPMGPVYRERLDTWLRVQGYWDSESEKSQPSKSASSILAAELRALADVIDSPDFPEKVKGDKFVTAVKGWSGALDEFETLLKKQQSTGTSRKIL